MTFINLTAAKKPAHIRISPGGTLNFNRSACEELIRMKVTNLEVFWNQEDKVLRFKKSDNSGKRIGFSRNGHAGVAPTTSLLRAIGIVDGANRNFPIALTEGGDFLFEIRVPNEFFDKAYWDKGY